MVEWKLGNLGGGKKLDSSLIPIGNVGQMIIGKFKGWFESYFLWDDNLSDEDTSKALDSSLIEILIKQWTNENLGKFRRAI